MHFHRGHLIGNWVADSCVALTAECAECAKGLLIFLMVEHGKLDVKMCLWHCCQDLLAPSYPPIQSRTDLRSWLSCCCWFDGSANIRKMKMKIMSFTHYVIWAKTFLFICIFIRLLRLQQQLGKGGRDKTRRGVRPRFSLLYYKNTLLRCIINSVTFRW